MPASVRLCIFGTHWIGHLPPPSIWGIQAPPTPAAFVLRGNQACPDACLTHGENFPARRSSGDVSLLAGLGIGRREAMLDSAAGGSGDASLDDMMLARFSIRLARESKPVLWTGRKARPDMEWCTTRQADGIDIDLCIERQAPNDDVTRYRDYYNPMET